MDSFNPEQNTCHQMTAVTFRVVTYSDALDPDSTEIENVTSHPLF